MVNKELRRLRRDDLLQIMINQQRQIDELSAALKRSEEALADRNLAISESGTLAEAAMRLSGVYEAAQSAADEYLAQMRRRADELLREAELTKVRADEALASAREEAGRILDRAREEAAAMGSPAPIQDTASAAETGDESEGRHRRGFGWRKRQS